MNIEWTTRAARQLVAAHAYIAGDNPLAADRIFARVYASIKNLGSNPRTGRLGRADNTRELVIPNTPYIVVYRIKEEIVIQILAILHGRRRWPSDF